MRRPDDVLNVNEAMERALDSLTLGTANLPDALAMMWNMARRAEKYDADLMRRAEGEAKRTRRGRT